MVRVSRVGRRSDRQPVDGRAADNAAAMTGVIEPLYARAMGDAWFQLADPIRALHSTHATTRARGRLRVEHGPHRLCRILAGSVRLPKPAAATPTELIVAGDHRGERWQRVFGARRFETWQYQSSPSEVSERYGCLEFRFRLCASGGRLLYVQREAALRFVTRRLRLPRCLAPHIEACEEAAGPGRVSVAVSVTLPGVGVLIAYDGIIDVTETPG